MTFSNLTIAQKMTWLSCAEGEGEMISRQRSNAVSRPISVEGVGDKDAGAEYYKKRCYNFEHGAALAE